MTEAQKILEMIEKVDPTDTEMLDEIDARVWCFLNEVNYLGAIVFEPHIDNFPNSLSLTHICDKPDRFNQRGFVFNHYNYVSYSSRQPYNATDTHSAIFSERYTRSRDALKSIRPEGWEYMQTWHTPSGYSGKFIKKKYDKDNFPSTGVVIGEFGTNVCATEELAELSVLIQAIEYERALLSKEKETND